MTPGNLALNLEAGRDKRQNQPPRNERTQRMVRVNSLFLWRKFLFQVPNAKCHMLNAKCHMLNAKRTPSASSAKSVAQGLIHHPSAIFPLCWKAIACAAKAATTGYANSQICFWHTNCDHGVTIATAS